MFHEHATVDSAVEGPGTSFEMGNTSGQDFDGIASLIGTVTSPPTTRHGQGTCGDS